MPNPKRSFVNPLTQPSTSSATYTTTETSTLPSTSSATLPATDTTTETSTLPNTFTSTSFKPAHRKRGAQAFEKTHERVTLWMDKNLKEQFEALADKQGVAKSTLLDEAIGDLLRKHGI